VKAAQNTNNRQEGRGVGSEQQRREKHICPCANSILVFSLDVLEAVKKRRSVRNYLDKPVEEEKLLKVLEAARLSPSAVNYQPWHFIVVKDKTAKEKLLKAYPRNWFAKAPVIVVVCASPEKAWRRSDGEEFWKIDAAIAMQSLVLAATSEGLATCWIGAFDEKKAKEALGIPANIRVVVMTPLGYSAEEMGPVAERKAAEQVVHYNHW
jgi:nitroreductase